MFRDAREIEDGAVLETDVCIIGTGAAGITCAAQLIGSGHRVIVLEAGSERADAATTAIGDVECDDLPIGVESQQRFFGGTTNSWWGKVALLDEGDFEGKDWVPASGWPLGRSDLVPSYRDACALMGLPDLTTFTLPEPGRGALLRGHDLEAKVLFWTRRPLNFGTLHRRLAPADGNVFTLLNANATELVADEHGRVDRVAVATLAGNRFQVAPAVVIVACGGIENARLLLNSTSRKASGIGNDHDQVGRYYMDHPRGPCGTVEMANAPSGLAPAYWSGKRHRSLRFRLGVALSPAAQAEHQALNSYVNLSPVYGGDGVGAIRALYRRGPAALRSGATARALLTGVPDIARYLMFKRYGRGRVRALTVENYMEQEPRAASRVTLSDRRDALGHRLARLNWSLSDRDRESVRTLHALLGGELRARGIGTLHSPLLDRSAQDWPVTGDAAHHMGTTRMGADSKTSVVDRDCRVHGIDNLYVAGSSVFPTGGSANPTLTIVALAARLGRHVHARLERPATVSRETVPAGSTAHHLDPVAEER